MPISSAKIRRCSFYLRPNWQGILRKGARGVGITRKRKFRPDDEKLRELILLISEWSQRDPKFGAIKLNKLLFYCDFSAYLTYGTPITRQEYFALEKGPAPRRLKPITEKMKEK